MSVLLISMAGHRKWLSDSMSTDVDQAEISSYATIFKDESLTLTTCSMCFYSTFIPKTTTF